MSDLISRSALIEYLENVTVTEGITFETGYKQILVDIRNQPTVEARPVVTGEWKDGIKCSVCGQVDTTKPNFCPNCGADMRGGKNE